MLFDTHAHYDDDAFDPDRELLLETLPERGVSLLVNPGCDVESSRRAVSYAKAYPHAVSYTHLDVYKRQRWRSLPRIAVT